MVVSCSPQPIMHTSPHMSLRSMSSPVHIKMLPRVGMHGFVCVCVCVCMYVHLYRALQVSWPL